MRCLECEDKGYLDSSYMKDNREYDMIILCPNCEDRTAYAAEIKRRYGNQKESEQEKINRVLGRKN